MSLNRGRIVALLVAALALGGATWLLAHRSRPADPERSGSAGERVRRGYDLYRQGLYRSAQAELLRAKQDGVRSADLEYGLAQLEVALASQEPSAQTRRANRARVQSETERHLRDALAIKPDHT